jgi:hypothetical protein
MVLIRATDSKVTGSSGTRVVVVVVAVVTVVEGSPGTTVVLGLDSGFLTRAGFRTTDGVSRARGHRHQREKQHGAWCSPADSGFHGRYHFPGRVSAKLMGYLRQVIRNTLDQGKGRGVAARES